MRLTVSLLACVALVACSSSAPSSKTLATSRTRSTEFHILNRIRTPEDFPAGYPSLAAKLRKFHLQPEDARLLPLARTSLDKAGRLRAWLVPGRRALCMVLEVPALPLAGGAGPQWRAQCDYLRGVLAGNVFVTFLSPSDSATAVLVGVVPDDVAEVGLLGTRFQSVRVEGNTWVAEGQHPQGALFRFRDGHVRRIQFKFEV
jgi:hypothetical protein